MDINLDHQNYYVDLSPDNKVRKMRDIVIAEEELFAMCEEKGKETAPKSKNKSSTSEQTNNMQD